MSMESTIITSVKLTDELFLECLKKIGKEMGTIDLEKGGIIYDESDGSRLQITWLTDEPVDYDAEELDAYQDLLGSEPLSFIELSYSRTINATPMVVQVTKIINSFFPAILDTGYGKVFSSEDILHLTTETF